MESGPPETPTTTRCPGSNSRKRAMVSSMRPVRAPPREVLCNPFSPVPQQGPHPAQRVQIVSAYTPRPILGEERLRDAGRPARRGCPEPDQVLRTDFWPVPPPLLLGEGPGLRARAAPILPDRFAAGG